MSQPGGDAGGVRRMQRGDAVGKFRPAIAPPSAVHGGGTAGSGQVSIGSSSVANWSMKSVQDGGDVAGRTTNLLTPTAT